MMEVTGKGRACIPGGLTITIGKGALLDKFPLALNICSALASRLTLLHCPAHQELSKL